MALFISLDPEVAKYNIGAGGAILILIELMLVIAALGVVTSFLAMRKSNPLPAPKISVAPPEGDIYDKS
ncbi:MAG TPA: hypothetical protein VG324_11955 [Blastocatellia bacterium]|nr:hypothetical protein [Blastocatellia bacterium]